jgi:ABC-2 type transport system ATP-binding protein
MIEVTNLTKIYPGRVAVDGITFSVGTGEIVGFLGPNGAGKSTTMRILTSYLPATSGSVKVAGYDVFNDSVRSRREIGYMPENVPLYDDLRVREFLTFRAKLKGLMGREVRRRVEYVIDRCNLGEMARKMIHTLSKGYRQRVGLADALVHGPKLLILDEPTNGLDPHQIRQVREFIRELGKDHTILLSSHILSEIEAVCNRVMILHHGRIKASDTPENLQAAISRHSQVQAEIEGDGEIVIEALRRLAGVRRVQAQEVGHGWQRYIVQPKGEGEGDLRPILAGLCAQRSWALRELTRQSATLEDVFIQMTQA